MKIVYHISVLSETKTPVLWVILGCMVYFGCYMLLLDDNSRRRFLVVEIGDLKIQAIRLDVWMICIMWFLVACAVRRRLVQDDTIQYTFVNMSSILLQVKIRRIEVWWCLPKHGLEGSWRIMDHWIEPFWHCEMCINKYSWGFGMSFFSQRFSKDVDSASYRQVPRAIPRSWGLGIPGTMVGLKVKPLTNGWGNLFYTRRG